MMSCESKIRTMREICINQQSVQGHNDRDDNKDKEVGQVMTRRTTRNERKACT
jgi:hypothetical protein